MKKRERVQLVRLADRAVAVRVVYGLVVGRVDKALRLQPRSDGRVVDDRVGVVEPVAQDGGRAGLCKGQAGLSGIAEHAVACPREVGTGQPHVFIQFVKDFGAGVVLAEEDGAPGRNVVGVERRDRRAPAP